MVSCPSVVIFTPIVSLTFYLFGVALYLLSWVLLPAPFVLELGIVTPVVLLVLIMIVPVLV